MTSDLLGISISGLRYSQTALSTTGHNIANAGTQGYSRQSVTGVTNPASYTGVGYMGNGVAVDSINRMVDDFVTQQLRTDTSLYRGLDTFNSYVGQMNGLLSDSSTGLSSSLTSFFASLQNAADDPTSIPARQLVISEAENLADRFNTLYDRFNAIKGNVDGAMEVAVNQINVLTQNLAELNGKIANSAGSGVTPNDLLDKRDETLRQLSELVSVRTLEQDDGQINVLIGNGQNLVVGNQARQLDLQASADNPSKRDVVVEAKPPLAITASIDSGELGGLLRFRDGPMEKAFNELGRVAVVMADTFNNVHQHGITLNGTFGGAFFNDINDPSLAAQRVMGHASNAAPQDRQMLLNISDSSQLQASNYEVSLEPGGLYRVTRLSDQTEVTSGILPARLPATVEFDGLELVLEGGSFQAGDKFLLQPTTYGAKDFAAEVNDPKALAFGGPLLTDAAIGNIGTGKISAGQLQSLTDANGNRLSLLADAGDLAPPLIVRFTSPTTYDVLDNSDPANPVHLDPPIRDQTFIPGTSNPIFSGEPGSTQVSSNGDLIGLPAGRTAVNLPAADADSEAVANGYPSEVLTVTSTGADGKPVTQNLFTNVNASAREIANQLSAVSGVSANAHTYAEISGFESLNTAAPPQLYVNGVAILPHTPDGSALTGDVPDPSTDAEAFYSFVAARINEAAAASTGGLNDGLHGTRAVAGWDAASSTFEVRIHDSDGDNIQVSLVSDGTGSLGVSDGTNPAVALVGSGAANAATVAVGGQLDVELADGVSLGSFPGVSMLFGDTAAADFAQPSYRGIQAVISGEPQTGDTFTIDFNSQGASDNRNALALVNLESAATINGVSSYSKGYGALVEEVGIQTSSSGVSRDAAEEVLNQTTQLRDSVSGVNLDEEAANLIRFEQMFSANAQVISVARELFDQLISSF